MYKKIIAASYVDKVGMNKVRAVDSWNHVQFHSSDVI